jgi:tetrahydromethanopterin S-methyltransferase subunit B
MILPQNTLTSYIRKASLLVLILIFSAATHVDAQPLEPEIKTLNQQYESLMKVSTTYEDYKVIKVAKLSSFWGNIQDSLAIVSTEKQKLVSSLDNVREDLLNTQIKLGEITAKLESSNHDRDRISFMGIPLTKGVYNSLVWGIIIILAVMTLFFFSRFKKSNIVTRSTKKECDALFEEFDSYKKNTREKELQIKRELQTAINTIDELRQ